MIDTDFPVLEFTAHARCDRCGAQAYTVAQHDDAKSELMFCLHHRKEFEKALKENGWTLTDDEEGMARDLFPKQFIDAGV